MAARKVCSSNRVSTCAGQQHCACQPQQPAATCRVLHKAKLAGCRGFVLCSSHGKTTLPMVPSSTPPASLNIRSVSTLRNVRKQLTGPRAPQKKFRRTLEHSGLQNACCPRYNRFIAPPVGCLCDNRRRWSERKLLLKFARLQDAAKQSLVRIWAPSWGSSTVCQPRTASQAGGVQRPSMGSSFCRISYLHSCAFPIESLEPRESPQGGVGSLLTLLRRGVASQRFLRRLCNIF